ncbi:cytochrome P450 [Xylariales sp. PMI_506]|nr:cytochrome P450 [Xylariales sp. PMI_506]
MVSFLLLVFGAVVAYSVYNVLSGWARNIAKARKTGFKYLISRKIGQLLSFIWHPVFKLLPRKYWEDVMMILTPDWQYRHKYQIFEKLGEVFLIATPGDVILYAANAEVAHQITSKRESFPKDTRSYGVLAMYGQNVVVTEGPMWRMHRKITSSSFNEKNTALVFDESVKQTKGLISLWLGPDGKGNKTIKTIEEDTMSLMLHIIGYVGFGLRLLWPGQTLPAETDPKWGKYSSFKPPGGHSLTFKEALGGTLHYIIVLLITPRWLLAKLPFDVCKKAKSSEDNFVKYMDEFLHDKVEDVKEGKPEQGMDIMGMLVRTSYGAQGANGKTPPEKNNKVVSLRDSEIIGNAFIMIVAGHETTANMMHFTLLHLAALPLEQRLIQRDINTIFGETDPQTWDYDSNVNALLASYVGACMNETLRVMPPVVAVPKSVPTDQDQIVVMDGEKHVLSRGMHIELTVPGLQNNPRYWPAKPSKLTGAESDVEDYVPERWFRTQASSGGQNSEVVEGADTEDFGGFAGPDTSASMFRPTRGSYIPFSDGARSCLGRRIAQVEMIAALSVLFQKHSVELAVDEWASDDEVERMSREEKRAVYAKAQAKARETLAKATSLITLKLHGNLFVPIRLVPRGQESYESLKKQELEVALDEYLAENSSQFSADPKLASYYASRARTVGSPVKKDYEAPADKLKVSKRRIAKAAEDAPAPDWPRCAHASLDAITRPSPVANKTTQHRRSEDEPAATSTSTALVQTPGRALSLASRIPLPATPADVAEAVDRSTIAVRNRVASIYKESGITEATHATRESLSTVTSILFVVSVFELYFLRPEVLPDRYAFTIPAISFLGTNDYPVLVPDLFLLLTSSFWSPTLLWFFTSTVLPTAAGYFFNLSIAHQTGRRTRTHNSNPEFVVDPLTFSIVKALISFVIYGQKVTFGGWINPESIARINGAVYGGYKGVLVGTAITGLVSFYDAVLRK